MAVNKILRYVIIGGIFLLPFLALIVDGSLYFPYITGKNFLFRIIIEVIFVCFVALAARDANWRPRWKSPLLIAATVFVGVLFVADLFGANFYKSFWSNYERMEGWITFIHLLVYLFIATKILNTENLWRRYFHIFLLVGIILGFIGIYQHAHGTARVDAELGNSTYLGALMIFNIFLLLLYLLRSIRNR